MEIANTEMAAAWDGDEGAHWAEHADRYEATNRTYGELLLDSAALDAGSHVLDVGCGTGATTRAAGRRAPDGAALGVDLSARMLERARKTAADEGISNVSFEQADAQVHPFARSAFDAVISSFGAMFFSDPVAAFANLRPALRPDGRVALTAWRELARNEWVCAIREALAAGRTLPQPPPDVPSPFAFAREAHVESVLAQAGYTDIALEPLEEPIRLGDDADHAYAFVSTFGITRGLTHDLDADAKADALAALRHTLDDHETADGVVFASSAWLITARVAS
jgi:SAM-dependent methyltransferase